jgi:hypothetical protein
VSFQTRLQASTRKINKLLKEIKEQVELKQEFFFKRYSYSVQQLLDCSEIKNIDAALAMSVK